MDHWDVEGYWGKAAILTKAVRPHSVTFSDEEGVIFTISREGIVLAPSCKYDERHARIVKVINTRLSENWDAKIREYKSRAENAEARMASLEKELNAVYTELEEIKNGR